MVYGTLGYQGPSMEERLRGAFYRKLALQRAGPGRAVMRGGGRRRGDGRERMEARYAERAARERAERMADQEAAMRSEEHRAKLEAMRAQVQNQQAQTGISERELSLRERLEPEKLAMLESQFARRMSGEEAQRGLAERELGYQTGPAHDLATYRAETERMGAGGIRGEDRINAIAMMNDPNLPPEARESIARELGVEAPAVQGQDVVTIAEQIKPEIEHVARILASDSPNDIVIWARNRFPNLGPEQFRAALLLALEDPDVQEQFARVRKPQDEVQRLVQPTSYTRWRYSQMLPEAANQLQAAFRRRLAPSGAGGGAEPVGPTQAMMNTGVFDALGRRVKGTVPIPRR